MAEAVLSDASASTIHNGSSNASVVAQHYNTIGEKGISVRNTSRILHLRNFNNWIKSVFISEFLEKVTDPKLWRPEINVLDLGCGKGGDLFKWRSGNIRHLICCDIAEQSVQDCKKRYSDLARKSHNLFSAEFIVADLTRKRIRSDYKDPTIKIDLVSCQFAFHYCFESLPQAECMMRNISECLRKGGYFIATIPNAYDIVARVKQSNDCCFGNEVFNISFDKDICDSLPLFGGKYNFKLEGVVDCPEFLVHFPTLIRLAEKFGLKFVKKSTFSDYFKENLEREMDLLIKMSALETYYSSENDKLLGSEDQYSYAKTFMEKNPDKKMIGTLSQTEWEAISLYMVFAFEKI